MDRKYLDCREHPSESKCTVTISADNEREIVDVAVQHAVKTHGERDTPELREWIRNSIKTGQPA